MSPTATKVRDEIILKKPLEEKPQASPEAPADDLDGENDDGEEVGGEGPATGQWFINFNDRLPELTTSGKAIQRRRRRRNPRRRN